MTGENREISEPEAAPHDTDDPAVAFEALRRTVERQGAQLGAEMTVIRRGLEAAFDQFDRFTPPTDCKPQLAQLVQQIGLVAERLQDVEQSPILRSGPEHYARALERSGEDLVRTAAQQLEGKGRDLEREAINLAAYTKSAYDRRSQDLRMWMAGGIGLLAGMLLVLLLPRILPFAADTHVAAIIMGEDRWRAGRSLIQSVSPADWHMLEIGGWLYQSNTETLNRCLADMEASEQAQSCAITVRVYSERGVVE